MTTTNTSPTIETLVFGEASYPIRRTTIAQLEAIEKAITTTGSSSLSVAIDVIAAGLSRDHAGIDARQIEASPDEMRVAMGQVLAVAGFREPPASDTGAAAQA